MTSPASLDAAVARLRLVAETRAAGATWAQIGAGMKMSGPEAKREVHHEAPGKPLPSGMGRNGSALTNMSVILTGVSGIL